MKFVDDDDDLIYVRTLPGKIKTYIFALDHKTLTVYIWLQLCQILTDFNNFSQPKPERNVQNRACGVFTTA